MRKYLSEREYVQLTEELKELVDRKRKPETSYDYAFGYGYDGCLESTPYLTIYTSYLGEYPHADVKDLHALCLGYGIAYSVKVEVQKDEENDDYKEVSEAKPKKTYH